MVTSSATVLVRTQSGTNYAYVAADLGYLVSRSNAGTAMADTLPGTGTGVMAAGWNVTIVNEFDLGNYQMTIQLADGTYTGSVTLSVPWIGGKDSGLILNGNASTPSNVVISTTGANAITVRNARVAISNLKIQTTTAGEGMLAWKQGYIEFYNLVFGACAYSHASAYDGGQIAATGNYTIAGGGFHHIFTTNNGMFSCAQTTTITVTGTPNFSVRFAHADILGRMLFASTTFSGSATGQRFYVAANSVINTNGAGLTYFPGNTAGTTTTGVFIYKKVVL